VLYKLDYSASVWHALLLCKPLCCMVSDVGSCACLSSCSSWKSLIYIWLNRCFVYIMHISRFCLTTVLQ